MYTCIYWLGSKRVVVGGGRPLDARRPSVQEALQAGEADLQHLVLVVLCVEGYSIVGVHLSTLKANEKST